jgi:hypothetical protein
VSSLSAPFLGFAETAERVGATTKRLEKSALLAATFETLDDDDLTLAARYFTGRAFPLRDQRTTNVGGSALFTAIREVTGAEADWLERQLVARGDFGDAAYDAWTAAAAPAAPPVHLTLSNVAAGLDRLAATAGSKK